MSGRIYAKILNFKLINKLSRGARTQYMYSLVIKVPRQRPCKAWYFTRDSSDSVLEKGKSKHFGFHIVADSANRGKRHLIVSY